MGEAEDTATPRSASDAQLKAAKDKKCPFCGQAFTSSSLGRHLDLYIRPKNPKAPDGIHAVDEIRKLRGGITRRQAKGSVSGTGMGSKKDYGRASTPMHKKQSVAGSEGSSARAQSPTNQDDDDDDEEEDDLDFKDVSWAKGSKTPDRRRTVSRQLHKAGLEQRQRRSDDAETAHATELALRELLKSVREATARASGAALFDFDPYALNFPSLCLHMLPAPATLFSPTPFAAPDSWSIGPPAQQQFDALNKHVRERLLAHQRQRQINHVYPHGPHGPNASSAASSPLPTPPLFGPDPQKLFCHIADSYNHWMLQSDQARHEYWQIAILRCYARADDRRRELDAQLETARREIDCLKAGRWTSGACDRSPITITLSADTAKDMGRQGMDFRNWDYDRLIDKCRSVVRENKAAASGMAAQTPLPAGQATTRSLSMASLPTNPFATGIQTRQGSPVKAEGGPFTAPPTVSGEPNSDHLDAEGDDDEDIHLDEHTPDEEPMTRQQPTSMMQQQQQQQQQQQHHMPIQPTPVPPSQQMQAHLQAQMHMAPTQAQLQAQANAQAQAWARQHMNQSRNQNFSPHQHQQMSPHVQHVQSHMSSAASSRRPSVQFTDLNANSVNGMTGPMGMATGMEGIEGHDEAFLRLDMGLSAGFVGGGA